MWCNLYKNLTSKCHGASVNVCRGCVFPAQTQPWGVGSLVMWHSVSRVCCHIWQAARSKPDTTNTWSHNYRQQANTHIQYTHTLIHTYAHKLTAVWNVRVYWLPLCQAPLPSMLPIADMFGDGCVFHWQLMASCLLQCFLSIVLGALLRCVLGLKKHLYFSVELMWMSEKQVWNKPAVESIQLASIYPSRFRKRETEGCFNFNVLVIVERRKTKKDYAWLIVRSLQWKHLKNYWIEALLEGVPLKCP